MEASERQVRDSVLQLADALDQLRNDHLCSYPNQTTCDCKYGGPRRFDRPGSEQTGCPELRAIVGELRYVAWTEQERQAKLTEVQRVLGALSRDSTRGEA